MLRYPQLILIIIFLVGMISCKTNQSNYTITPTVWMFKIAILYPNGDDKNFDMHYYENKHMPMVAGLLGENLKFYEIDKGISGRTPSDKAPFVAIGFFYVRDVADYNKVIGMNRDSIISDFKNYTNIQPIINMSEIKHFGYNSK